MCGIVGALNYGRSAEPVTAELLVRLRETLRHRGPDDAGVWVEAGGGVGLAHRRLSIVDLSADGRQPLSNEDGSIYVTFNGEIYNHAEWRPWLEGRGHRLRSRSDTEAIVHLYEEFGLDCVDHLDGMFAFAVWDARAGRLVLARDRLGVKPLYYTRQNGVLVFASEIKALLAHPLVGRGLDLTALGHYLTLKTAPAPRTLFEGIRKLGAGSMLTCDREGNIAQRVYWDAVSSERPQATLPDEDEVVETTRDLLERSVAKRLMADVPVGVFLSGGLDSSAIVALTAPRLDRPVQTFSVGIRDVPGCNESEYAWQVVRQFGAEHREVMIGRQEVVDYLPELVHHQDEPLSDPVCVPLYYVSRLARESGVKVVLVGEGSDEQFLGYDSRVAFLKRYGRTWGPLLSLPNGVLRGMHGATAAFRRLSGLGARAERVLEKAARGEEVFVGSQAFTEAAVRRLLNGPGGEFAGGASEAVTEAARPFRAAWPVADVASRMSYIDLKIRVAELLLMRIDKVTMSVGLEAREPFLDYRLVEHVMTLPVGLKLKRWEPKYVLKQAMAGVLPPNIVRRPKRPFAAPVGAWLRDGLGGFARDAILGSRLRELGLIHYPIAERMLDDHVAGRADNGVALWALINLSAWYDHWF